MPLSRKVKRSLVCGAIAAIITVMLMFGSTMAWFQDTEVLINTYTFGEFDVDIVDPSSKDTHMQLVPFLKADGSEYAAGEAFFFEPGATFRLGTFCVKNRGNVPFHYVLSFELPTNGDVKLMEAMDLLVKIGDGAPVPLSSFNAADWRLEGGAVSEPIEIQLHMRESAGNEYMNLSVSGILVKVFAYQEGVTLEEAQAD